MDVRNASDEKLLKLIRKSIFLIMIFALIAIPSLLFYSLYIEVRLPKPAPIPQLVAKEINIQKFKTDLVEDTLSGRALTNDILITSDVSKKSMLPYAEQALVLFRCGDEFRKLSGVGIDRPDGAEMVSQVEFIRSELERIAAPPSKGKEFVNASVSYLCKVLSDPSVIELRKKGQINSVLVPAMNYYIGLWDQVIQHNAELSDEESLRIAHAKSLVSKLCIAAAALLSLFIALAFFLILVRLEEQLKDINLSIRNIQK